MHKMKISLKTAFLVMVCFAVASCVVNNQLRKRQFRLLVEYCLSKDGTGLRNLSDADATADESDDSPPTMVDAAWDMLDFSKSSR